MKYKFFAVSFLIIIFINNAVFAEVSDEMFNALNERVNKMDEIFNKLNNYYLKVDNIESDLNETKAVTESGLPDNVGAGTNNEIMSQELNDRLSMVEGAVKVLEDRSSLFDFSDEVRRNQEYVCENDHVFPITGDGNRCPVCGSKQRSRTLEKIYKFARREDISERIAAAFDREYAKHVSIGLSATSIVQQIVASDVEEDNFAEGSFDLTFITKPLPNSVFFIDLEAIGGNGPDELIGSAAGLNADSGSFQDDDGLDRISVKEVWLETHLFNEKLDIVAGKLDLGNYFDSNAIANDETSQFITAAFVHTPTFENPGGAPGFVAFFDTQKGLRFGLGVQSGENSGDKITDKLYTIAELDYSTEFFFGKQGTYRIWVRTSGEKDENKGLGVSIDQDLSKRLTAFGRFGVNQNDGGDADIASSWSTGVRLRSPFFSRLDDEVAVAFGMVDMVGGDHESSAEAYYKFKINDHFAVSPNVQAVFDPAGVGRDDSVFVAGIRTQINF